MKRCRSKWLVWPARILAGAPILALFWLTTQPISPPSLADRAETIVGRRAFSIAGWEATTLAGRAVEALPGQGPTVARGDTDRVRAYFAAVDTTNRLARRETELLAARPNNWEADLAAVRSELATARADQAARAPAARAVLEKQFEAAVEELGLRHGLIEIQRVSGWPPLLIRVTPAVFFTFAQLPLALSIGPRDRIAVTYSNLLTADLSAAEQTNLEDDLDRTLQVASIITPIGGFAAYPSLIPANGGLAASLATIGHEWIHHYLFARPLGLNYFASYEMRTLNETVADLAGREISDRVRQTYYPPAEPIPRPAAPSPPAQPPREDFPSAMRRIRRETERLLAAGDLQAVDRYLAGQQRALAAEGYALRKLNTTYLAFFGSYSGGGNSLEEPLRRLRDRSDSLAAFLETISRAGSPAEAQRILAGG